MNHSVVSALETFNKLLSLQIFLIIQIALLSTEYCVSILASEGHR